MPPDSYDLVGTTVGGKYTLVRRLGEGGMGVVYEAVNAVMGRRVALKLLTGDALADDSQERMLREARVAALVRHAHVVDVLDASTDPELGVFLVMELLDGEALDTLIEREGPLAEPQILAILRPIAEALDVAHRSGVVHRDIKPSNIFLHRGPTGELVPKLVDFGIARAEGPSLTRTGVMAGTLCYMAPEQMRDAKRADSRSDIWSLGVVVYECYAGRLPFRGTTAIEIMSEVLDARLCRLDEVAPSTPQHVVETVHRALALDANARPQSAGELMRLLETPSLRETRAVDTELAAPGVSPVTLPLALPLSGPARAHDAPPTRPRPGRALALAALSMTTATLAGGTALYLTYFRAATEPDAASNAPVAPAIQADSSGSRAIRVSTRRPLPELVRVAVPGGTARLGSTPEDLAGARAECASEASAHCDQHPFGLEEPMLTATLESFELSRYEVSFAQFFAWLSQQAHLSHERRPSGDWVEDKGRPLVAVESHNAPGAGFSITRGELMLKPAFAGLPAAWVTQPAARRFCEAVGGRLPSSVEWEWAARGAARRRYPWGNAFFTCHRAIAAQSSGMACQTPAPGAVNVTQQLQDESPEGVAGLAGNVAEWVTDAVPPSAIPAQDCAASTCFLVRGGDWATGGYATRAASRRVRGEQQASGAVGFRCAFSLR